MPNSAEGTVDKATAFTGVVRKVIISRPKIKRRTYGVTQWEKGTPGCEGFI